MLFDTHSHIYLNKKHNVDEIISGMKKDNLEKIVCVGIDIETSQKAIEIAKKYPGIVYATVGIHPNDCRKYHTKELETFNKIENLILENIKVIVGIGETGYDFHWCEESEKESEYIIQKKYFEKQISLAKRFGLPLIIHNRDAGEKTLETLKEKDFKNFILHCFSEDLNFAFKAIYFSEVAKISFSGSVTYKSAQNIQHVAANIPLSRILIETDCPYLSPQKVRGTENYPNNVKYILDYITELRLDNGKKETKEEIESEIYKNSLEIFSIK